MWRNGDFRKLRGILKDKVDAKDAVKLQHEIMIR